MGAPSGGPPRKPLDPAFVKLAEMQSNRYKFFRWTPRTARISFVYIVLIPGMIGYLGYKTDGLIDFTAKQRGDTILER